MAKKKAIGAGAAGVCISGAGPSLLAILDRTKHDPRSVMDNMVAGFGEEGVESDGFVTKVGGARRRYEGRARWALRCIDCGTSFGEDPPGYTCSRCGGLLEAVKEGGAVSRADLSEGRRTESGGSGRSCRSAPRSALSRSTRGAPLS